MNHTQKAISDAIEGGWQPKCDYEIESSGHNDEWSVWTMKESGSSFTVGHEEAFLDPLFWRAVGRKRGWNEEPFNGGYGSKAMLFMNFLMEGDNYETALSKLN